jgi:hypothetical protein
MQKNISEKRSKSQIGGRRKLLATEISRMMINYLKKNWGGPFFKKAYERSSFDNYGSLLNVIFPITKEGEYTLFDKSNNEHIPKKMDILLHIVFIEFKDYGIKSIMTPYGQFNERQTSPTDNVSIGVTLFVDKSLFNKKFPLENLNRLIPELKTLIHHELIHFYQYLKGRSTRKSGTMIEYYTDPLEVEAYVRQFIKYSRLVKRNPKMVFRAELEYARTQIIAGGESPETAKNQIKYVKKAWEDEIKKVYPEEYKKYFKRGLFSSF